MKVSYMQVHNIVLYTMIFTMLFTIGFFNNDAYALTNEIFDDEGVALAFSLDVPVDGAEDIQIQYVITRQFTDKTDVGFDLGLKFLDNTEFLEFDETACYVIGGDFDVLRCTYDMTDQYELRDSVTIKPNPTDHEFCLAYGIPYGTSPLTTGHICYEQIRDYDFEEIIIERTFSDNFGNEFSLKLLSTKPCVTEEDTGRCGWFSAHQNWIEGYLMALNINTPTTVLTKINLENAQLFQVGDECIEIDANNLECTHTFNEGDLMLNYKWGFRSDARTEANQHVFHRVVLNSLPVSMTSEDIRNADYEIFNQLHSKPNIIAVIEEERGTNCLAAFAAYGSELEPKVDNLREIRNKMYETQSGQTMYAINDFYYSFSPTITDWERENPMFKEIVKLFITPSITSFGILDHDIMNSENELIGYVASIVTLNVGMYIVAPAIVIFAVKRKLT